MKVSFEIADWLAFLLGTLTGVAGIVLYTKVANWRKRRDSTTPTDEAKEPFHSDDSESDKAAKANDAHSSDSSGDTNGTDSDPTITPIKEKSPAKVENGTSTEEKQVTETKADVPSPVEQLKPSIFNQSAPAVPFRFGESIDHKSFDFGSATFHKIGTQDTKYSPPFGSDTLKKVEFSKEVTTKLHCISGMDEYKNKSLDELRFEDSGVNGTKVDADHFVEIIEESQLPALKPDFHHLFPTECSVEHRANIKFLITGTNVDVEQHERMLHLVVRDHMPNAEFLKKYGRYVECMRIYCKGINKFEPIVYQEIGEHCADTLKAIEFYDMEGHELDHFKVNFPNIESIRFKSGKIGKIDTKATAAFRKYFSNVHQLEFCKDLIVEDRDLLNEELQNLTEIEAGVGFFNFAEEDIKKALELNKEHLRRITLRGELSATLIRFINDTIPEIEKLSLKLGYNQLRNDQRFVFEKLQELELTSTLYINEISQFSFGQLQKITLNLAILPDSWVDDIIAKNQQIHHLSLNKINSENVLSINDDIVLKMVKILPNLQLLEMNNAGYLKLDTIRELLKVDGLRELLLSGLNTETYSALRTNSEFKALPWKVMLCSKFLGARFEREPANSDLISFHHSLSNIKESDLKRESERIKLVELHNWYDTQLKKVTILKEGTKYSLVPQFNAKKVKAVEPASAQNTPGFSFNITKPFFGTDPMSTSAFNPPAGQKQEQKTETGPKSFNFSSDLSANRPFGKTLAPQVADCEKTPKENCKTFTFQFNESAAKNDTADNASVKPENAVFQFGTSEQKPTEAVTVSKQRTFRTVARRNDPK